jgi:hypothetical protein
MKTRLITGLTCFIVFPVVIVIVWIFLVLFLSGIGLLCDFLTWSPLTECKRIFLDGYVVSVRMIVEPDARNFVLRLLSIFAVIGLLMGLVVETEDIK